MRVLLNFLLQNCFDYNTIVIQAAAWRLHRKKVALRTVPCASDTGNLFINGGLFLSDKKLIIHQNKYAGETAVISVRLSKTMISELEKAAKESGRTRNEIIALCLEFALEQMEIQ